MKKEVMEVKAIRFGKKAWKKVEEAAKRWGDTSSDIVRHAVDVYLSNGNANDRK